MKTIDFAFFGTSLIAVFVLEALKSAGLMPKLIVTMPPRERGRGLELQETAVALWAKANNLPLSYTWEEFEAATWDAAVVVDYGKILPQRLIEIPKRGFLN